MKYTVISADNHVVEPPGTFVDRVPAHLKDRVPRVLPAKDGGEGWSLDGQTPANSFTDRRVGSTLLSPGGGLHWSDMPRGTYDGQAHIADMALDGVDGAVLYPDFMRKVYEWPDREVGLACIRAYNDWLLDEFCAADATRLIGMCMLPTEYGTDELVDEAKRVIRKGARGFFLPYYPSRPLHDPYYDPLWAVISESGAVASLHSGFGGTRPPAPAPRPVGLENTDLTWAGPVLSYFSAIQPLTALIFSGLFQRFPTLKFLAAEVNGGWVPYWMQEMHDTLARGVQRQGRTLTFEPGDCVGRNVFVTVLADRIGFKLACEDERLANAMLYSTDYQHSITLWPHSQEVIPGLTAGMDERIKHNILAGNAVRIFGLE
ncbi:MAG: amidohydrolase [Chloroflexi bacterium]|nr:amidohydrolase [Chloroflexota bacterium]